MQANYATILDFWSKTITIPNIDYFSLDYSDFPQLFIII